MNLNNWITQARAHWKEFLPTRYKELRQAGKLDEALKNAAERTYEELNELEASGMKQQEAWEMVREQYLFPPEENKWG
jgi:arsenate reductase-like glutaredoxin family protein